MYAYCTKTTHGMCQIMVHTKRERIGFSFKNIYYTVASLEQRVRKLMFTKSLTHKGKRSTSRYIHNMDKRENKMFSTLSNTIINHRFAVYVRGYYCKKGLYKMNNLTDILRIMCIVFR